MPAYQAEKSSTPPKCKELAYSGRDDAASRPKRNSAKANTAKTNSGQRKVHPWCGAAAKLVAKVDNHCEGGAGNPLLAQQQAQQEK